MFHWPGGVRETAWNMREPPNFGVNPQTLAWTTFTPKSTFLVDLGNTNSMPIMPLLLDLFKEVGIAHTIWPLVVWHGWLGVCGQCAAPSSCPSRKARCSRQCTNKHGKALKLPIATRVLTMGACYVLWLILVGLVFAMSFLEWIRTWSQSNKSCQSWFCAIPVTRVGHDDWSHLQLYGVWKFHVTITISIWLSLIS